MNKITHADQINKENKNRKGEGEIVPAFNLAPRHEDVRKRGGITPRILNLSTRCLCTVNMKLSLWLFLTEHGAMKAYWGS
jgi:hypothetical protein